MSVGDILGELTSVVTLRIVILRTKPSSITEIKDKLLRLLILQSHAVLRSAGCPLDEVSVQVEKKLEEIFCIKLAAYIMKLSHRSP